MKTCTLYGVIAAVATAITILGLYFLGFHSDAAKLSAAKWIGGVVGIAISVTVPVLGIRARRDEVPADKPFGYGSALGAGVLIAVVASFLSSIFTYVYNAFINPGLTDLMVQDAMDKMAAKGVSGTQAENMEKGMRFMMAPAMQSGFGFIAGILFGVAVALIAAAFLKRPDPSAQKA